jgi:cobalamin-dependent methionine synthase I
MPGFAESWDLAVRSRVIFGIFWLNGIVGVGTVSGMPACPNIQDQYKLLELLGSDRINLHMDESEQLYPEQSTTAIVAYHPAAKYFSA